jgi:hypothetical protein
VGTGWEFDGTGDVYPISLALMGRRMVGVDEYAYWQAPGTGAVVSP